MYLSLAGLVLCVSVRCCVHGHTYIMTEINYACR